MKPLKSRVLRKVPTGRTNSNNTLYTLHITQTQHNTHYKITMTNATKEDLENIVGLFERYYKEDIAKAVQNRDKTSIWVDYTTLYTFSQDLADDVLRKPEEGRELLEEALELVELPSDEDLSEYDVRIHNLGEHTRAIEELRDEDVESLRALSGQVSKASAVRPVVKIAAYECMRCGTYNYVEIEGEMGEPHECIACERQGPFEFDYQESTVKNHQLIRIKQPPEDASQSQQYGNEIDAHVEGDLVGEVEAGTRADIPGVLQVERDENDPTLDFYFDAWAVDKHDDDYQNLNVNEYKESLQRMVSQENPYQKLANSIAPGIVGAREIDIETPWGETYDKYWWVRLAVGISNLFGGWRKANQDGTYQRGSSHTLFIGDPSTGKSSIMNAVKEIAPRSAKESGRNASGPGLTAAAVNDDFGDSQWSLEAGALVKAHNGVACIDEIDKMQKDGLSRLHSALEEQRLEINKAGIDATLKCETSLLAAGNPEDSRFDNYDSDQSQIDIVSSLMDRFDLVYTFKDIPDEEKDKDVAETVIEQRAESGLVAQNELPESQRETGDPEVPIEKLKAWVALARQQYEPVFRDKAVKDRLRDYYVQVRSENADGGDSNNDDEPVPASVRTLDGLLRLSEASARMRLSHEVEMIDVEMAIALVKISLQDIGYDPETGKMDIDYAKGRGSWSQKERKKKMMGIVDSLETSESGAPKEEVINLAVEAGIEKSKAEHELIGLAKEGDLYEPRNQKYRVS